MQDRKLIIRADSQTAEAFEDGVLVKTYRVSTSKNGAGCVEGSYCTPPGKLRVAQKIGDGLAEGAVLKSREPTGDVWSADPSNPLSSSADDMVLTRILWLDGQDEDNKNSFDRYIYIHGTNREEDLGTPASFGCIRFSNKDVIEIYDFLGEGAEVEVIYPAPNPPLKLPDPKP